MSIAKIQLHSDLELILKNIKNTVTKIYFLKSVGLKPMDIARKLGIIPQHVYNELDRKCENRKEKIPNFDKKLKYKYK